MILSRLGCNPIYTASGPGPSLDVNRTWTKRNDYAPNNECVGSLHECLKRVVLKEGKEREKFF